MAPLTCLQVLAVVVGVVGGSAPSLTPLESAFLTKADALNQSSWYGYNSSLLAFLFYFPGNKIYGWESGQRVLCSNASGQHWLPADGQSYFSTDVPGSMVGPSYRRMVVGQFDWVFNVSGRVCPEWTLPLLVTIGQNADWTVNTWVNVSSRQDGWISAQPANSSLRVELTQGLHHPSSPAPITRIAFSERVEDSCYAALSHSCAVHLADNQTARCGLCAAAHGVALDRAGCLEHSNARDVVEYWCDCAGSVGSCGGPPPPIPRNRSKF